MKIQFKIKKILIFNIPWNFQLKWKCFGNIIIRKTKNQFLSPVFTRMFLLPLWDLKKKIFWWIAKKYCEEPGKFLGRLLEGRLCSRYTSDIDSDYSNWLRNRLYTVKGQTIKAYIGRVNVTAQKMKFSIKDFFSKCDQIRLTM